MIDIKLYEKNQNYREDYNATLKNRGEDRSELDQVVKLNQKRRQMIFNMEKLIVDRRKAESLLVSLKDQEKKDCLNKAKAIGEEVTQLKEKLRLLEAQVEQHLLHLPNMCHASVPVGTSSESNTVINQEGQVPSFSFPIKTHLELGAEQIDTQRATKIAGARFSFLRGSLAQLERALAQYMLDVHTKKHGYEEVHVPLIVQESALVHTGQLPKFKEDVFSVKEKNCYLIPTGEVPLTGFFSNEILSEKDLPTKFVSYTPCFRSEAGAYGKDTKGLIRQHQFTKVELVIFSHPNKSYEELENLCQHASQILIDLELPYRVVNLCTGDIGFAASKCYDIEVWLPSENMYREVSSCSNCEDYQARRGQIRFRSKNGNAFVHTLNGSGLAVGRTLIALLENNQNEDGSVRIPKVLQPYMNGRKVILDKK